MLHLPRGQSLYLTEQKKSFHLEPLDTMSQVSKAKQSKGNRKKASQGARAEAAEPAYYARVGSPSLPANHVQQLAVRMTRGAIRATGELWISYPC